MEQMPVAPKIPPKPVQPLVHRVNRAAALAGVTRSTIYNWMGDGRLKFVEVGGIRLVYDHSLRGLLKIDEPAA
jgi:excisionase family DNA binding protein